MYERVAAIDVGKREVAVTVRVPGQTAGIRSQQTRKFRTFYQVLRQMVSWLVDHGVTHVAMEATGVYWKPIFHALCETDTLEVVLVNARHVKNVPGRKTDLLTELPVGAGGREVRGLGGLARFPRRDQRRGCAAGAVRAGGAAGRVA
jgi:transposase